MIVCEFLFVEGDKQISSGDKYMMVNEFPLVEGGKQWVVSGD